jgi:hypothetical protein
VKIAVLGWGSLIWCPRNLQIKGQWNENGPLLPIEFARLSRDGRLTLVLYPGADKVQTLWGYSVYEDLDQAIENLREREETIRERIGFVSIPEGTSNCQVVPQVLDSIRQWAVEREFDAVIWTDLPSNFKKETGMDINEDNVIIYLKDLTGDELKEAEKYIRRAHGQVMTKIRRRIEDELDWRDG